LQFIAVAAEKLIQRLQSDPKIMQQTFFASYLNDLVFLMRGMTDF